MSPPSTLAGGITLGGVIRGAFHSAILGYWLDEGSWAAATRQRRCGWRCASHFALTREEV